MILAKVIGRIISNQKTIDLKGAKLLLVKEIDEFQNYIEWATYVAIDEVGAGQGDVVLLGECSNKERKDINQDLSIVAIVESIDIDK